MLTVLPVPKFFVSKVAVPPSVTASPAITPLGVYVTVAAVVPSYTLLLAVAVAVMALAVMLPVPDTPVLKLALEMK